jgi:Ca-activated chloride channel family protein
MKPLSQVVRSVLVVSTILIAACRTSHVPQPQPSSVPLTGSVVLDGMALPGATVTLSLPNGVSRTAVTDSSGRFTFAAVPPGPFRLVSELEGLNTVTYDGKAGEATPAITIAMRISSVAEAITVTAAASGAPSYSAEYLNGYIQHAGVAELDYIDTRTDRTSTFSIDVDTASYSIVRSTLAAGKLPPPEEVRIEELINYFSYAYPDPRDDRPFSVTTEVAAAPWNPAHRLLRIGIHGRQLAPWQTKPCNLVFLIDTSGSMNGADGLPLLKKAFRLLVGQLRAEDRVAIVAYAGSAGLVLPSTSGADKQRILDAIEQLESGGSTDGGAGIELAYKVAKENFLDGATNRVILATDGDFNVGLSSEEELLKLIEEKRKDDIELSTIGAGERNYQDKTMELLADKGNGNYAFVDSLFEARKVFVEQLGGTLVTIAKDVKLQLELDPRQVASFRQIGYEDRQLAAEDFHDDTKDAGELGSGHTVTALYELVPAAGATKGKIATLQLRYKPPHGTRSELLSVDVGDEGRGAYEASDDLKFAAAVAEFGMLLRDSKFKGTASWDDALQLAKISRGADLQGYRGELVKLVQSAKTLAQPSVAAASSQ